MVEYTEELDERTIGVTRPVAPGDNVVRRGEDIGAGEVALAAGQRIRPQDMGLLAAIGVMEVPVLQAPKVGIISTGDELVAPAEKPAAGQVRDINSYALYGAVQGCGGLPRLYVIVRDVYADLAKVLRQALQENDIVLLSGGSSVGARDVAARAIESLAEPDYFFYFFNAQDLSMRSRLNTFSRHAVNTAQIATISNRNPEVVNIPLIGIFQSPHHPAFILPELLVRLNRK
jgi:molybdopterin molybdotransferase